MAATLNPTATIAPAAAATRLWDAVVIGAGLAGCIAARELARAGRDVLLLEARRFPRPKVCGGCLNQKAVQHLDHLGLSPIIGESGAIPLTEFRLQMPGWTPQYALPAGWSVTRPTLDGLLLQRTIDAGVHYLDEATARLDDEIRPDFRTVRIDHPEGPCAAAGRIVICAEGLSRSSVTKAAGFDVQIARDPFVGAGVVLPEGEVPAELRERCPAGSITMAVGDGGYVGIAQAENARYSFGAAIRPSVVKRERSVGGAVVRLLRDAGLPDLAPLASHSWQGTPLLRSRARRPSGERVFLVGDSAGYVEPFTGEGMAWAIEGGMTLAPIAQASIQGWTLDLQRQWDQAYQQRIRRSQWISRGFLQALHRPGLGRVTAAVFKRFPRAASHIIAAINRPARSTRNGPDE